MTELRRSPLFLMILVLVTASGPFAMQMFLPALPVIQRDFMADAGTVQLTLSLSMLSIAVTTLAYGPLSDRFGRKPVLMVGMLLFALGTVVSVTADTVWVLIGGRIVQAGGGAAGMVLARSMVRDVYGHTDSARVIGYLTIAMILAPMVSPALGGILIDSFSWRAIFVVAGILAALMLLLIVLRLVETHPDRSETANVTALVGNMVQLLRTRRFLGFALQSSFQMAMFFAFISAAPYLMSTTLHRPATEYGLLFAFVAGGFIVGTFTATRLIGRHETDRVIRFGVLAVFIALAAGLAYMVAMPLSPFVLFAPAVLISVLQGLVISNAQASAININPRAAGAASGLTGFLQMTISATAAQIVGSLNDGTVVPMVSVMGAAGVLSVVVLPLIGVRAAESPAPQ